MIGLTANIIDAVFLMMGKTSKFMNARGNRWCFALDGVCIIYWFFIDLDRGLYSQAASVFVSAGISIYGWHRWSKHPPGRQ